MKGMHQRFLFCGSIEEPAPCGYDLFKAGIGPKPRVLGLEWYADPYWDTVFPAAQKKLAYVGCKGLSSIWAALQTDPLIEIYRVPTELSNYLITHLDGGA